MVNTDKLKGLMAEHGYSGKKMAAVLGITPKTFYTKMQRKVFDSDEISTMIESLEISDPMPIFFAPNVTQ